MANNLSGSKADVLIPRYQIAIEGLKRNFLDRGTVITQLVVVRMEDDLEDISDQLASASASVNSGSQLQVLFHF